MDQESVVYGCIKDVALPRNEGKHRRINRRAMLALPSSEDWPLLSREMFAIPAANRNGGGHYHTQVMHFGASYRAVEHEWNAWITRFESLLREMYWTSATVHLETELNGLHTFSWTSLSDTHVPGAGDILVQCEWSRDSAVSL